MRKTIIFIYLISLFFSEKINEQNFESIIDTIKDSASEYLLSEESFPETVNVRKNADMSRTMVFTTKSKFHEHIVSVNLQAKNDKLSLSLYDAKSNNIKKDITYDKEVLEIQKPAFKELIHRMIEKPRAKVGFRMIEDVLADIMPIFNALTFIKDTDDNKVMLKFTGHESTIALFNIVYNQKPSDVAGRYNYSMDVSYDISVVNNKPDHFQFSIEVYNEESANNLIQTIKSTSNINNYFNNLCTVAGIYIDAMNSLGFKDIEKIEEDTEDGKGRNQITIKMRFYKTYIITRLKYDPKKGPVGTYSAVSYKVLNLTDDELVLDKKELSSLEFTRHLKTDLYKLFVDNNFSDELDIYKDVLKKFKEVYNTTYSLNYSDAKLTEKKEILNGDKIIGFKLNNNRKVNVIATSKSREKPDICEFVYSENKGYIEIKFRDGFAGDFSNYRFKIEDFDLETVNNYITMIVSTSYNYGILVSK